MPKHAITPKNYTSTNSMFHLSAGCREGGDGQCDGLMYADNGGWAGSDECNCECHRGGPRWDNLRTVAEYEAAHAEKNRTSLTPRRKTPAHRA